MRRAAGQLTHAAADAIREIRSIFAAVGVPSNAIYVRHYRPTRFALASIKLTIRGWSRRQDRAASGRPTSDRPSIPAISKTGRTGISAAPTNAILRPWSTILLILIQPRGETPPYSPRRSIVIDHYRKGENPSATYVAMTQAKSATSEND